MPVTIDMNVPYANACDVHVAQRDDTAAVHFTADPHGGPEAMWFRFRVRRKQDASVQRLRLVLTNVHNLLGGGGERTIRPVVRAARGAWQRLENGTNEYQPDGRLHLSWEIDAPQTFLDVALCYPYGQPEVDELLGDLQRNNSTGDNSTGDMWQGDTIGVSQGGRPLVRVSNDYGAEGGERAGIYLLARQHSSETPGSWALDGFLRRAAELGKDAPLIWAVPLTNIDGIEQGDYGKDNFPYDLNRAWGRPPMRHETLVMQRDMRRWKKRCRPALVFDFHAPGMSEDDGLYLYMPDETVTPYHEQAKQWAAPLREALGPAYASEQFGRVAGYHSRWNTPSAARFAYERLEVLGLSLEAPYSMAGNTLLTIEAYREAGARLAEAVAATAGAAVRAGQ